MKGHNTHCPQRTIPFNMSLQSDCRQGKAFTCPANRWIDCGSNFSNEWPNLLKGRVIDQQTWTGKKNADRNHQYIEQEKNDLAPWRGTQKWLNGGKRSDRRQPREAAP
jgi:hypothetical protein